MSDFNSSLPVRTETNGDVVVKVVDSTTPSQGLNVDAAGKVTTKLNDGAGNAVTSQASGAQQALDVGINVGGTQIDPRQVRALTASDTVTVVATDLDIRNLVFATDKVDVSGSTVALDATTLAALENTSVTVTNAAGAAAVNIQDGGNSITVDGTVAVSNLPATVDTNYGTVGANTIRVASQLGNATGAANYGNGVTGAQTLRTAANLAVAGADVSALNPIPVVLSSDPSGTEINNYNTAGSVASAASSNHDYPVTAAKTLILTQIIAAASGKMKIEVQVETSTNVFATRYVQFNSTAAPNMIMEFASPVQIAAGLRVRIIRTNLDNQAQDLYSTICGNEVP